MSEIKKISEEELNKLQACVGEMNKIQGSIGDLELRKHNALHAYNDLKNVLAEIQKELQDKYGDVNVNLNDGTISAQEPKLEVQ
jgi:hypothetical protein